MCVNLKVFEYVFVTANAVTDNPNLILISSLAFLIKFKWNCILIISYWSFPYPIEVNILYPNSNADLVVIVRSLGEIAKYCGKESLTCRAV